MPEKEYKKTYNIGVLFHLLFGTERNIKLPSNSGIITNNLETRFAALGFCPEEGIRHLKGSAIYSFLGITGQKSNSGKGSMKVANNIAKRIENDIGIIFNELYPIKEFYTKNLDKKYLSKKTAIMLAIDDDEHIANNYSTLVDTFKNASDPCISFGAAFALALMAPTGYFEKSTVKEGRENIKKIADEYLIEAKKLDIKSKEGSVYKNDNEENRNNTQSMSQFEIINTITSLNDSYIKNERLMVVYENLEKAFNDSSAKFIVYNDENPKHVHYTDIIAYFTFFEGVAHVINLGLIEYIDDLFGDRFFKFIHNDYVQREELYAEPSSYVNIFKLYDKWYHHRMNSPQKRLIANIEKRIPERYLKDGTYYKEKYSKDMRSTIETGDKEFSNKDHKKVNLLYRRLLPGDLEAYLKLQEGICSEFSHKNDLFQPSSCDEILDSMLIDYCYGLFEGRRLVAACICVLNPEDKRSLQRYLDEGTTCRNSITADSIVVDKVFRGYGIQTFFLQEIDKLGKTIKADCVIATVSPDNEYSLHNFEKAGYTAKKQLLMYEPETQRNIVYKKL